MKKPPFSEILVRIKENQEETFYTKTGLKFTYTIFDNGFFPSRTNYRISVSDIEKAYDLVPFDGPGVVNDIVRGPANLWAVLNDQRIRKDDW